LLKFVQSESFGLFTIHSHFPDHFSCSFTNSLSGHQIAHVSLCYQVGNRNTSGGYNEGKD